MNLIESSWFLISFLIILIVLVVDPKSSITGGGKNAVLGLFSSPSSGQQFIYNFSAALILIFFVLTTVLSLSSWNKKGREELSKLLPVPFYQIRNLSKECNIC